ncbi:MAG: hypothetical protein E6G97_09915 [Alphaproteobacteria bacterium]|nr:MAG: hypothetical protein E6G97_09915 [Alphaproteobacteria bacterium]
MQNLTRRRLFSSAIGSVLWGTFSAAGIAQPNRPTRRVTAEPALPRLVKLNTDLTVTVGFELAPGSYLWEGGLPNDPTLDVKYLEAGTVTRNGVENSVLSVSLRELHPKLRSGQRFSQSFSPETLSGLSFFWFNAITESATLVVGALPTTLWYDLSFFVQLTVSGATAEYRYRAPPVEQPGITSAVASDMIGLFRAH